MTRVSITRRFEFDAAHRLFGYRGRCAACHGHRYVGEVTVSAASLDGLGMVMDFGVLSTVVGGWIDSNWDHAMLYNSDDEDARKFVMSHSNRGYVFEGCNPTAEVMASHLFVVVGELLSSELQVERVRIFETPDSYADYPAPRIA